MQPQWDIFLWYLPSRFTWTTFIKRVRPWDNNADINLLKTWCWYTGRIKQFILIFWIQKSLNNWGNKLQNTFLKRKKEDRKAGRRERERGNKSHGKVILPKCLQINRQRWFFSVFKTSKLNSFFKFAYHNIQTILPQLVWKQILPFSYILLLYLHNRFGWEKIEKILSLGLQYKTHKYLETSEKQIDF